MTVLSAELKKILIGNKGLLVIAAAVILQLITGLFTTRFYEHSYSVDVYKNYLEQIEGEYTAEKAEYINSRYEEISEIISVHKIMEDRYLNGEITLEEFSAYNDDYFLASAENETVAYIVEKCMYYENSEGFDKIFFFETDIEDFLTSSGMNYIIFVMLLCLAIPAFDSEFQSNAVSLILTSRDGHKKTAFVKTAAVFFLAFLSSLLIYSSIFICFVIKNGSANLNQPLSNIMTFPFYGDLKIINFIIFDCLIKSLCWAVTSVFFMIFTVLIKNTVFSFFVSVFAFFVASNIRILTDSTAVNYIFCPVNLSGMYGSDLNPMLLGIISAAKTVIYFFIIYKIWTKPRN